MEKFASFQAKVEGFYSQVGAGYLFIKKFQDAYLKYGSKCWIYFMERVHSESQVQKDIEALYGALTTACTVGVGQDICLQYKETMDGLRAWIDMVNRYKSGGDKETKISQLEAVLDRKFHDRYKGGLKGWVSDYETAFAELKALGVDKWKSDEDKKRQILRNLCADDSLEKHTYKLTMKSKEYTAIFTQGAFWLHRHARKACH